MLRKQGAFAELSVSAWRLIRVTMRVACVRYTILLSVYVRRVTSHHNVIIFFLGGVLVHPVAPKHVDKLK
jgi:K+-sensing histidine kinase KdpD